MAKRHWSIAPLLRPHSVTFSFALGAAIGEAMADLLAPWPLKIVLDNVLGSRKIHGWLNPAILRIAGDDKLAIVKFAALAALGIAIVGAVASYAEKSLTTTTGQWVMHDLRRTLYSQIQFLSLSFHDHKQTGDLISRVTKDIEAIQTFIASNLLGAVVDVITLAGMIGVMFYVNWRFTLIALSVAPPLFLVIYHYTRRIKKAARDVRHKEGEMISLIEEVLSSMRLVKAFGREDYERERLEAESLETVEIALHARKIKARLTPLVEIIVACGTAMVLWFGARMVLGGALSAGSLVLFIAYLGKMYKPMQDLSKMTDSYAKAAIGYERIKEILETERDVRDLPRARTLRSVRGEIEFDHVSFCYDADREILRDVSFRVEPGQVVALVGPTGAGKTTIASLIGRFYDPTEGSVRIDGIDVRELQQRSLREHMSFVLQETFLFHGTIWENIAYGKPDARRDEILRAAAIANAAEFIDKMPGGYDALVGEHGVTLSGGQRQRIAIARAVIRNAPILILDEPSSGLDAVSEKLVFEALDRLMENKTCIVIAHRLVTIHRADTILVIKDGSIVERGTHQQLVASGGLYAQLDATLYERRS